MGFTEAIIFWVQFVVEFKFAIDVEELDSEGKLISEVTFSCEMKRRIINIDETALTLDGTVCIRGGRPAETLSIKHGTNVGTDAS